jgi:hypothetical protein
VDEDEDSESSSDDDSESSDASDDSEGELTDENGRWKSGANLEAKWIDGEFFHGVVQRVFKVGTYSFHFDDGDFLRSVPHDEIRERTAVVPFGQPDEEVTFVSGESVSEEAEDEDEEEETDEEPEEGTKAYYVFALRSFLKSQMEHHEHFVHGTRTNNTESFHSVCNKYYHKGSTVTFRQYVMRKTFAAMDWNENKLGMRTDAAVPPWKAALLAEFLRRKLAIRKQKSAKKSRS